MLGYLCIYTQKGCIKKFRIGSQVVTINVKAGWKAGTKVTFEDVNPPVTFVVEERKHPWLEREVPVCE
jgi:hypothetical protein